MSRTTFNRLASIVCPMLPPGLSSNGKSYQPVERLLAFLYFCGHDTTSLHGSYAHGMSEGGVWQSVDYVINAMYDNFVPEWLTLPTEEQARREARIFHDHTGFPDQLAWAVADGVHFTVRSSRVCLEKISQKHCYYHILKQLKVLSCNNDNIYV